MLLEFSTFPSTSKFQQAKIVRLHCLIGKRFCKHFAHQKHLLNAQIPSRTLKKMFLLSNSLTLQNLILSIICTVKKISKNKPPNSFNIAVINSPYQTALVFKGWIVFYHEQYQGGIPRYNTRYHWTQESIKHIRIQLLAVWA